MISKVLLTLSLMVFLSAQFSFAADPSASLPECSKIVPACESQHYKSGEHKKSGKGLWIDCVGAIAKGKTVPGVTGFTSDDAKACQKAENAWQKAKKATKAATVPAGK